MSVLMDQSWTDKQLPRKWVHISLVFVRAFLYTYSLQFALRGAHSVQSASSSVAPKTTRLLGRNSYKQKYTEWVKLFEGEWFIDDYWTSGWFVWMVYLHFIAILIYLYSVSCILRVRSSFNYFFSFHSSWGGVCFLLQYFVWLLFPWTWFSLHSHHWK